MRAAMEAGEAFAFEPQIVRILTLPGDETNIFRPADGLANAEFHVPAFES